MPTTTGRATDLITFSRASLATVTDSDGKIKWAPHNLFQASEQFDAASWNNNLVTVSANAVAAPNGTTTADRIVEQASSGLHFARQSITTAAARHTFSVFAKAGERTRILIYNFTFAGGSAFDLSTGTIVGDVDAAPVSKSITAVGNGWYLCSVTFDCTAASNDLRIYLGNDAGSYNYAGDSSKGIYLWGAHLYRSDLGGMQANASAYPMYNPSTPRNLLGWSEAFDNVAWAVEGTSVAANVAAAPNGSLTAERLTETAVTSAHALSQTVTLVAGRYKYSVYLKKGSGATAPDWVQLTFGGNSFDWANFNLSTGAIGLQSGSSAAIAPVGDGWYRCSLDCVPTAGNTSVQVAFTNNTNASSRRPSYAGATTSDVLVWGAQLSDSASLDPYVPNFGAAPSAAAYHGPRIDYDPVTLACKGLLVEEQRSNSLTYSQEFDNGAWLKGVGYNSTVSANTSAAPDNTTTADSVLADSAGGTGNVILARSVAVTSGTSYTLTFFAKAGTLSWIRLFALGYTSPGNGGAYFNLSGAGAVGTVDSGYTASIAAFGNGWYRCSLSFTAGSSVTGELRLLLANANGDTAVARNGTSSVLVWGAQLEAGSFATSYIPTGAATATRTADVASISTQAFPYSSTEGTIVVNASSPCVAAVANMITLDNGTTQERIRLLTDVASVKTIVTESNTTQANLSPGSATANTPFKFAVAYKVNDFAAVVNGSAAATDAAGNVPVVNIARLGADSSGNYLNGHVRQITYLPRRISNAELQSRTA